MGYRTNIELIEKVNLIKKPKYRKNLKNIEIFYSRNF